MARSREVPESALLSGHAHPDAVAVVRQARSSQVLLATLLKVFNGELRSRLPDDERAEKGW